MPNGSAETISLSEALERVVQRSQQAFFAQFQLLRIEAEEDLTRTLDGGALLFAGLMVLATAWVAFMALTVQLLRQPLSLAASLAIVGGLNVAIGAWLVASSVRTLRRIRLMRPDAEPSTAEIAPTVFGAGIPEQREAVKPVIAETEQQLKQTLEELLSAIHSRLDFGQRIVERPLPWVVGSLMLGFLLANPRPR
jgi:hypothetical protein